MLTLLGVVLFFGSELIYNEFGYVNDANWSIFYFSFHYISIAIICAEHSIINDWKVFKYFFLLFGLLALSYAIIELSFMNVPYDRYIQGIENRIVSNITIVVTTFVSGIITYILWHKHFEAFYRRLLARL